MVDQRILTTILIGDAHSGKSALVERMVKQSFNEVYTPTIGAGYQALKLSEKDRVRFWDVSGQERFASLLPIYLRQASVILAVFNVCDANGLTGLTTWLNRAKNNSTSAIRVVLVANKIDLGEARQVSEEMAVQFMQHWNSTEGNERCQIDEYVETSALTGQGVQKLIDATTVGFVDAPVTPVQVKQADQQKENLQRRLQNYIDRIERHKTRLGGADFSYGFSFFKASRAANRYANYQLARELLVKLDNNSIQEAFTGYDALRREHINENVDRGINSRELNSIIATATRIR